MFFTLSIRRTLMSLSCAAVAALLSPQTARGDIEPYTARIVVGRALVLSGPGDKFYPTDALTPGETVEVYREEAGGWLGIRPPKDSFSWISEKQLREQGGGLAEVRDDDVPSRIGSQLSDKRNAVQVALKKGEVVEVIGRETIDGATWFKIAPPAGEFRWIQAGNVEPVGAIAESGSESRGADENVVVVGATSAEAGEQVAIKEEAAETPTSDAANSGDAWRAAPNQNAATGAPGNKIAPPPLAPAPQTSSIPTTPIPATSTPATPITPIPNTSPPAPAAASMTPAAPGVVDVPRALTDIEMRLSRMASAPPQLWNTERLQHDTELLLGQARTQQERDSVKATMVKIDQFTSLARRYQPVPGTIPGQPLAPVAALPAAQTANGQFDAVGVLKPVVSKRPGAPQFALVDDRGQVLTFVTPSPDVNLQPYLGHRVGIAGNRGFMPEFNRAHVTAGRVTPLVR